MVAFKFIRGIPSPFLVVAIVSVLIISLLIITRNFSRTAQSESLHVPVVVKQLSRQDGSIPVELSCGQAQLANEHEITGFSCTVKNNSNQSMNAITAVYSIITSRDGKEAGTPSYLTLNAVINPDIDNEHLHQSIAPGVEQQLEVNETTIYDEATVNRVEISIDYVEFADGSTFGPNEMGSKIIASTREGASKYKNWLAQQYIKSGGSSDQIVPLLQKEYPLPTQIGLNDMYLRQGAKIYRSHLLTIYNAKGAGEIERILHNGK